MERGTVGAAFLGGGVRPLYDWRSPMTSHKHSHDTGRPPLRLRPLPRPAAPEPTEDPAHAEPPADEGSAEPAIDSADNAAEDADAPGSDAEWIHEWEQPEPGAP